MSDDNSSQADSLIDEGHFPLRSILGAPLNYDDILNKDLLELLGLGNVSDEEKGEMYTKMGETIENRVIARVADQMTDEELDKWSELADEDPATAGENLREKGIDIPTLIAEESLIYKTELVSLANRP